MKEALAQVCPDLPVTLSSDLSREYREYERTSTAVVNAYIQPITRTYLGQLDRTLAEAGSTGQFLLTRSVGGVMTVASRTDGASTADPLRGRRRGSSARLPSARSSGFPI